MAGLRDAWRFEEAFRIETLLFVMLAPVGIFLGNSPIERVLLVGCLLLVLVTELLNSGIEATVDRVGEEHHLLSGRAKDIGSAAVFVALLNVAMTWGMILIPRI